MTKQDIIDIIRGCINLNMIDANGLPGTWVNSIDGYIIAEKAADKILELYIKEKQKDYLIEMMKKDEELGLYEPKSDEINKEPFTHVLKVIERIRDSFDDSVEVYTKGSCVKFAMILKEIFPQGVILYDQNHAIFELDGNYYDINGFAEKTDNHIPLEEYGILKAYDSMNLKYENKVS